MTAPVATGRDRDDLASLPATLALTALTLVTAAGMGRLFRGTGWVGPVLASAVVAHVVCWIGRRARWSNPVTILAALAATFLAVAWTVLPATTFYGLTLGRTVTTMAHDLSRARQAFSNLQAPAPALPGFVVAASAGAALMAVLSDWAAFRLRATLEAVVPALATLIFVSVLANNAPRPDWAAGFVAALGLFVATNDATGRARFRARFTGGSGRRAYLTGAGLGLTAVIVISGAVIGPRLPGAHAAPVLSVHRSGANGPARRTTISPLVDIRARLINESQVELFTVSAAQPSYWRLTSLDHFDGTIWSSDEPYSPVGVQIPVAPPPNPSRTLRQRFQISDLGSIWLPAAYLPTEVGGAPGVSWDSQSQSLISRAATSDGEAYRVTSLQPDFSSDELRQASLAAEVVSPVERDKYTRLPAGVPARVVDLARRVTASASTPYDKALALQNFLRDNYTYSLNVPAGHSDSALIDFLFVNREGYCEQFAGAYAVMARAIGLPTRVAVGFTPGQQEADGLWHVSGLYAHAWPEVLMGQFGWVAFEPTPGRGMPGATSYTGVQPQQAGAKGTTAAIPAQPAASPGPVPPARPHSSLLAGAGSAAAHHSRSRGGLAPGIVPVVTAAGVLGGTGLLWVVVVPATQAARRRRRRRRAGGEADRVIVAWEEAAERLAASGVARRPGETLVEHARRASEQARLAADVATALRDLAGQAAEAAYGPTGRPVGSAMAVARAALVENALRTAASRWQRLGWELDPRPRRSVTRA